MVKKKISFQSVKDIQEFKIKHEGTITISVPLKSIFNLINFFNEKEFDEENIVDV